MMENAVQHSVKSIVKCGYSKILLHCSRTIVIILPSSSEASYEKNLFSCFRENMFWFEFVPNKNKVFNQFSYHLLIITQRHS